MFKATLPGETVKWFIFANDTLRRTAAVNQASIELLEIVRTVDL